MVSLLFSYLVTQAQILVLRGAPSSFREMLSLVRSGRFEGAERAHFQDTLKCWFLSIKWIRHNSFSRWMQPEHLSGDLGFCFVFTWTSSFTQSFLWCYENHYLKGHFYYEQLSGTWMTWWSHAGIWWLWSVPHVITILQFKWMWTLTIGVFW